MSEELAGARARGEAGEERKRVCVWRETRRTEVGEVVVVEVGLGAVGAEAAAPVVDAPRSPSPLVFGGSLVEGDR